MLSRSGSFVVLKSSQRAAGMPALGVATDIHGKPLSNTSSSLMDFDGAGVRSPANPSMGPAGAGGLRMAPNTALLPFSRPGSRNLSSASSGLSVGSKNNPHSAGFSLPSSRASSRSGARNFTSPAAGVKYNVDYVGSGGRILGM